MAKLGNVARFSGKGKQISLQAQTALRIDREEDEAYRAVVEGRLETLMGLGRVALAPWNRDRASFSRLQELAQDAESFQSAVSAFKFAGTWKERGPSYPEMIRMVCPSK